MADSVWVKICGMTNLPDVLEAQQAGADAVGFIFVPSSPRVVTRDTVATILPQLSSALLTVAVVANENFDFLKGLLRVCPVKAIQFHGQESPEEVLAFKGQAKLFKAIRVEDAQSLKQIPLYRGVDGIVLDAHRPRALGGTGTTFDWNLALEAKGEGIPIIVAGGLNPGNVADLIRRVQPHGVDVASGVELSPGTKDPLLVRQFILKAKQAGSPED